MHGGHRLRPLPLRPPPNAVPGSRVVYEKLRRLRAAQRAAVAGPPAASVAHVERVEWHILPDPATAAAALQTGEVDWYEQPAFDLLPLLARARDIRIELIDPLGSLMMMRINHLHPPFDNAGDAPRRAGGGTSSDYMQAVVGNARYSASAEAFFACGTPLGTDEGVAVMPATWTARDAMLREAGYADENGRHHQPDRHPGQPRDVAGHRRPAAAHGHERRAGGDRLGSACWPGAPTATRRSAAAGGSSTRLVGGRRGEPRLHAPLRTHGAEAWAGWPTDAEIEALRDRFIDAADPAEGARLAAQMQERAFEMVPYVPWARCAADGLPPQRAGHRARAGAVLLGR